MSDLLAHLPSTRLVPAGHYGPAEATGVAARRVEGLAAATMSARRDAAALLCHAAGAAGFILADAPRACPAGPITAIGTGPGRWLVLGEGMTGRALIDRLGGLAGGHAVFTDQSAANLVFELAGEKARECLAKGLALDLHPSVFAPGDAATTQVALVGVTFWQVDAAPTYRCAVARSFAPAFLRWLTASAAEFGFALAGTGRD